MQNETSRRSDSRHGLVTRALAGVCHRCGVCAFAARRPGTNLEKVMRWHRTWCPAWRAHTKVFGPKQLI